MKASKECAGAFSLDNETRTTDIRLAAALMCVGIEPCSPPFTIKRPDRPGSWMQFTFPARSEDGRFSVKELLGYWHEGIAFIDRCPDHAFAYVMAALLQHRAIVEGLKSAEDVAFIRKGLSVAMLPMNATAECERRILGKESK